MQCCYCSPVHCCLVALTAKIGFETIQHRCQVRLYTENIGFRFGTHRWHNIYDDTVCRDALLSCTRGHPGHGLHRERRHLVGRMHHGRDDTWRCAVPWHRSHRSMEQNYRYVYFEYICLCCGGWFFHHTEHIAATLMQKREREREKLHLRSSPTPAMLFCCTTPPLLCFGTFGAGRRLLFVYLVSTMNKVSMTFI